MNDVDNSDQKRRELRAFENRLAAKIAAEEDVRARRRIREMWELTPRQKRACDWAIWGGLLAMIVIAAVAGHFGGLW